MFKYFKKPFKGGLHLKGNKESTKNKTIDRQLKPQRIYLSLQQRNGVLLNALVKVGDKVGKGQLVAKGENDMCVPLHSSINGVVEAIKPYISIHPSGIKCNTIIIKADNDITGWAKELTPCNTAELTADEMIKRVLDAGVVGLGGAGFPTGIKLRLARDTKVHTLLINGGECEPYLTCDDRLMQEKPAEIVAGVSLMMQAIGCEHGIIAIEDNKPESIAAIENASSESSNIKVHVVPSLYPMGSERHLIKTVTNITIPPGELSANYGILVNNVATAQAVYHAIRFQRPLVDRVFTISGKGIERPRNLVIPVGTRVGDLITACGGLTMNAERLIAGGPMMGQVISSPSAPVDKSIGGILALSSDEVRAEQTNDCVRCGRCVRSCPMGLMPFQMGALSRVSDYEALQDYGIDNCLFCGACSFVCPSRIPLVQQFMHSRGQINAQRSMTKKMALAKQLAKGRTARIAKELAAKKAAKAAKSKRRPRRAVKAVAEVGEKNG
ncbi:MAG: electron transport complex subunit RsxC [Colwellia sp.]